MKEGAEHSKRKSEQTDISKSEQVGKPEWERDGKEIQGDRWHDVKWAIFSLLYKQLIFYFYILFIRVERQPWDIQSCQKQRRADFRTITIH